jgi:small-conductance mechanosensitive channel
MKLFVCFTSFLLLLKVSCRASVVPFLSESRKSVRTESSNENGVSVSRNKSDTRDVSDEVNETPDKRPSFLSRKGRLLSLRPVIKKCLSIIIRDKDVLNLVSTTLSGTMWVFIFMSCVGTFGLDTKPLISLVTVSGFTLGLAAKDILTSTIAAAYMISMRPFKRDMVISIGEHRGRVRSFDTNFVKLVTSDKRLILIPMASVYGKPIVIHNEA